MTDAEAKVLAAIRRIVHAVDRHSKTVEKATGLTLPQLVVLAAVRAQGQVTSARLSAAVSLSPPTVTLILDRLESRGLIERYRNLEDRRIVHSRLTAAGAEVLARSPRFLHERFVQRFADLPAARQAAMIATLDEVAELMGAPEVPPAPVPLEVGLAAEPQST